MDTVEFKFANEVFTMLPTVVTNSDRAKLTSNSSVINKQIVSNVHDKADTEVPTPIVDTLKELRNSLPEHIEQVELVKNTLLDAKEKLSKIVDCFHDNTPRVLYEGTTYNLYTDSLHTIAFIVVDTELSYPRFENKLNKAYRDLLDGDDLYTFMNLVKENKEISGISLKDAFSAIFEYSDRLGILSSRLVNAKKALENADIQSQEFYGQNGQELVYEVNSLIGELEKALEVKALVVDKENGFMIKLVNAVELIEC